MCHGKPKDVQNCMLLACAYVQGQVTGVIGGKNKPKALHTAVEVAARFLKPGLEFRLWPQNVCIQIFKLSGLVVENDVGNMKVSSMLSKWAKISAQTIKNKTTSYASSLSGDIDSLVDEILEIQG